MSYYSDNPEVSTCSHPGCGRRKNARGLCRGHWGMARAGRELTEIPRRNKWYLPDGSRMECQWHECKEGVDTGGLCPYHYQHWNYEMNRGATKRSKNTKKRDPITGELLPCSYAGCGGRIHYGGYCPGHIEMVRRGEPLRPLRHRIPCPVVGCEADMLWSSTTCSPHVSTARRHGLTPEGLIELFARSKGECGNSLCGEKENLQVDHDHSCCPGSKSCGRCIRGLLCGPCNRSLGLAQDSPQKLWGLILYLGGDLDQEATR